MTTQTRSSNRAARFVAQLQQYPTVGRFEPSSWAKLATRELAMTRGFLIAEGAEPIIYHGLRAWRWPEGTS